MSSPAHHSVTRLLQDARAGAPEAAEALLPLVYTELKGLAAMQFARERGDHTLQPTALVHEAWMKLAGDLGHADDRRQFFCVASRAMRQVLTDHARAHRSAKRGEGRRPLTLDGELFGLRGDGPDLVDLDDSLTRLASLNERHARLVELRFFGGLTIPETADSLGVSEATVERDWFSVRGWLRRELERAG